MTAEILLIFFGVRGSCPCSGLVFSKYGGNTSCVLLRILNKDTQTNIIFDLGTGLRYLGNYLAFQNTLKDKPSKKLRATAFVSHLHWDHIQGLPFFPQVDDPDTVLDVYGPVDENVSLDELYKRIMTEPFFPVGVNDLNAKITFYGLRSGSEINLGHVNIKALKVPHLGPLTLGYRISTFGKTITFISDHQMPADGNLIAPEVLELAKRCDLLIHDAQYTEEEFEKKPDWGHSTFGYALKIGKQAGAKTLVLYHHDPSHTDDILDKIALQAKALISAEASEMNVLMAKDGMIINLTNGLVSQAEPY
jgi:phosphoribosyl 1,2-cyclic phosphodiesterase